MGRARVNIILAPICLKLTLLQTWRPNKNNIYLLFKNTKLIIIQRPNQISEKNLSHMTVLLLLLLKLGVMMGETPKLVKENHGGALQDMDDLEV